MEKDLIQAKKYLSEQGYGNGTNYTTNLVAVLLANYAASHPPAAPVSGEELTEECMVSIEGQSELHANEYYEKGSDSKREMTEHELWLNRKYNFIVGAQWALSATLPTREPEGWISVEDRPLFTTDSKGNWTCTKDGDREFIAAVPYNDITRMDENNLWWIKHCVIEDEIGLCIVGEVGNEPAGWDMSDIVFWQLLPSPPNQSPIK